MMTMVAKGGVVRLTWYGQAALPFAALDASIIVCLAISDKT